MIELGLKEIGGALIVMGGGIIGLIKGGYLKIGKENGAKAKPVVEYCPRHELLEEDRKERWQKLDETVASWDKLQQLMVLENAARKSENEAQEKRLNHLDDTIVDISNSLKSIEKDVAVNEATMVQREQFITDTMKTIVTDWKETTKIIFDKLDNK